MKPHKSSEDVLLHLNEIVKRATLELIKNENLPSTKWRTSRITEVFPGPKTKSLPRQLTVVLHTQWRTVIKGGKTATVGRRVWPSEHVSDTAEKRKKIEKDEGWSHSESGEKEDLGVLDREADEELWTRIRKMPCGLYRDKLWRERLEKGATILARHRDN
ncbi:hypothetical protein TNCV_4072381 [Trichonephila clavipes]|uniref:DUF5641 domain-containing protein n=1 Tax=Trichonephila clavipes TaxID=2585209 RepID=A0A8X7BG00_TRICX|nr:hypothetical protein TNCV_4072381 [Trichonephila clavipes]